MAIYTRELNYLFSKLPHGHILPLEKVLYYLHLWTSYLYLKTFKLVFPILLFSSISLIAEEGFLISPCYSTDLSIYYYILL